MRKWVFWREWKSVVTQLLLIITLVLLPLPPWLHPRPIPSNPIPAGKRWLWDWQLGPDLRPYGPPVGPTLSTIRGTCHSGHWLSFSLRTKSRSSGTGDKATTNYSLNSKRLCCRCPLVVSGNDDGQWNCDFFYTTQEKHCGSLFVSFADIVFVSWLEYHRIVGNNSRRRNLVIWIAMTIIVDLVLKSIVIQDPRRVVEI